MVAGSRDLGLGLRVIAAAVVGVFLLGSVAEAKNAGPTEREIEEHACYGDAMSLCKEFVPDESKITACMEQKKAQLSPGCAALFKP